MKNTNEQNDFIPSIFDEENPQFLIWKKHSTSHTNIAFKKLSDVRIFEGILFKRSKRTNFWKSRYYVLFEDRLACFKNGREKKEQAYCLVLNVRVEKILSSNEKDDKFGIRFIQNCQYFDLYARAKDVQEKWLEKLKPFCVFTNYSSNYINMKLIGKGSFAKVYLAKRKIDNLEFAVKTFDKSVILKTDKAKPSLINEINIMRKLEHENIIKLYEVYESANHIYLVLELLSGGELFNKITSKGHYTEKDACILMKKLLSALEYLHNHGIMHRDIKLENLILKSNDNEVDIKIVDFGLATYFNSNEWLFRRCGTPGYVAPEVLADEKYDHKVDAFSAGVILYILLTSGSPFYGKSYNEILHKNKKCEVKFDFTERGKKVSEKAIDLLKKLLAKDPKLRITTKEALEHSWILNEGQGESEEKHLMQLLSAQENMKKFQEEHRFNVKNIKPKDLDKQVLLEKCWHCPSPVLNGNVLTVVDSRIMSPKTPAISTPRHHPIGMCSPLYNPHQQQGSARGPPLTNMFLSPHQQTRKLGQTIMTQKQNNTSTTNNSNSTWGTDEGDNLDMYSDEKSQMEKNIPKYYMFNNHNAHEVGMLATNSNESSNSNSSTCHNGPTLPKQSVPKDEREFKKRALLVQESLLSFLKNADQAKIDNKDKGNNNNTGQPYIKPPMIEPNFITPLTMSMNHPSSSTIYNTNNNNKKVQKNSDDPANILKNSKKQLSSNEEQKISSVKNLLRNF